MLWAFRLYLLLQHTLWLPVSAKDVDLYCKKGKVRAMKGSSEVVYILKNNIKHAVSDWDSFLALGFNQSDIHIYNDSLVDDYPTGDPIHISPPDLEDVMPPPPAFCPCGSSSSNDLSSYEKLQNVADSFNLHRTEQRNRKGPEWPASRTPKIKLSLYTRDHRKILL